MIWLVFSQNHPPAVSSLWSCSGLKQNAAGEMAQTIRALATTLTAWPIFHPWDPHNGGRLRPLTYTYALWLTRALAQIQKSKKQQNIRHMLQMQSSGLFFSWLEVKVGNRSFYTIPSREGSTERHSRTCAGPPNYSSWWWRKAWPHPLREHC